MENKTDVENDVLLSYVGMDNLYENGKLMFIAGKEDAAEGNVGTLELPAQARNVGIDPDNDGDVSLLSYMYTKGGQRQVRQLMFKLNSFAGDPAKISVLVPSADGNWVTQTADVTLVDSAGTVVSINPHGLAQYGNYLYLPDYQNGKISIVNAGDLEAAADGTAVEVRTFDLGAVWDPDPTYAARGQAAVVLGNYLYALGIDADDSAQNFGPSRLFRLAINGVTGDLTLDAQIETGFNAQSIIPVTDGRTVYLLVPAIGGRQDYGGKTNGTASNISVVPATGTWPVTASVKITGDPMATPATAYDIHAVAAAMRDRSSVLYILTQLYDTSSTEALWRIYRTTVATFLGIADGTALSVAATAGNLTVVDQGTITAPGYAGLYFWDMLYEQTPDTASDAGDRVWVGEGTPILVTRAAVYGSPSGLTQNPYVDFGYLGGINVNAGAFDLIIETQNQAAWGVSLKRNFNKAQTAKPTDEEIKAVQAKSK